MNNIKLRTVGWVVLIWLISTFTYYWGMSTLNESHRLVHEFITHDFILDNIVDVHDSTGIMVKWDDKAKIGYILTCAHVVHKHKDVPISILDEEGEKYEELCPVVATDTKHDLALLTTKRKIPVFKIMSDADYKRRIKPGMVVWAAGHPTDDIEGQMLSVGQIISRDFSYVCNFCPEHEKVEGILHNATIWYGCSGGPLIDPNTDQVVGLNFKLAPTLRSRYGLAIPAPVVNAFLAENLK